MIYLPRLLVKRYIPQMTYFSVQRYFVMFLLTNWKSEHWRKNYLCYIFLLFFLLFIVVFLFWKYLFLLPSLCLLFLCFFVLKTEWLFECLSLCRLSFCRCFMDTLSLFMFGLLKVFCTKLLGVLILFYEHSHLNLV